MSLVTSYLEEWVPRTRTGRLVKEGKITSIDQIFELNLPVREVEIVDALLPNLRHEIVNVNLVQRQTDSPLRARKLAK